MPVAQLVHLFESMDEIQQDIDLHQVPPAFKKSSAVPRRQRLSLKTLFRSHARGTSASSTAAATESSRASASSPTFSSGSFECLPTSIIWTSPSTETQDPFSNVSPVATSPNRRPVRPIKVQRTFSSTSLALQSEYRLDQLHNPGLNLFEPRPHSTSSGSTFAAEPVIMDGIIQVMRGG